MITKRFILTCLLAIVVASTSCTTSGLFFSTHLTNVELSESNYKIVAKNVKGEAQAEYIIGITGAFRGELQTLAVARVGGEEMLYQQAMENLWKNFENDYSQVVEGRKLALVNVRYDSDAINLILYTRPKISIRADVIEFGN